MQASRELCDVHVLGEIFPKFHILQKYPSNECKICSQFNRNREDPFLVDLKYKNR